MRGAALALAAWICAAVPALAARKVALVVGNDNYRWIERLHKSRADAHAYASVLRQKGFVVREAYDVSAAALNALAFRFGRSLRPDDTALFAYSGHGWSDGAQNFMLGVDSPRSDRPDDLRRASTPIRNGADGVMDRIERSGAGLRILIYDTCRDAPSVAGGSRRGAAYSRGPASLGALPSGTFVVFSDGTGEGAIDRLSSTDANPNSLFTRVFAPLLRSDLTLQGAVRSSQATVLELSRSVGAFQEPAYQDVGAGPVCLSRACR